MVFKKGHVPHNKGKILVPSDEKRKRQLQYQKKRREKKRDELKKKRDSKRHEIKFEVLSHYSKKTIKFSNSML